MDLCFRTLGFNLFSESFLAPVTSYLHKTMFKIDNFRHIFHKKIFHLLVKFYLSIDSQELKARFPHAYIHLPKEERQLTKYSRSISFDALSALSIFQGDSRFATMTVVSNQLTPEESEWLFPNSSLCPSDNLESTFQNRDNLFILHGTPLDAIKHSLMEYTPNQHDQDKKVLYYLSGTTSFQEILSNFEFATSNADQSQSFLVIFVPQDSTDSHYYPFLSKNPLNPRRGLQNKSAREIFRLLSKTKFDTDTHFWKQVRDDALAEKIVTYFPNARITHSPALFNKFPEMHFIDPLTRKKLLCSSDAKILQNLIDFHSALRKSNLLHSELQMRQQTKKAPVQIGVVPKEAKELLAARLQNQLFTNWKLIVSDSDLSNFLQDDTSNKKLIYMDGNIDYSPDFLTILNSTLERSGRKFVLAKTQTLTDFPKYPLVSEVSTPEKLNMLVRANDDESLNFLTSTHIPQLSGGVKLLFPREVQKDKSYFYDRESQVKNFKLSVVVPVFNNGEVLLSKCIYSLMQNHSWKDMEVLLIDDGSTDNTTVGICMWLENQFANIHTYFFPKGGSGSASRARNLGIEVASSPLISFLDPDNEISQSGYDHLYEVISSKKAMRYETPFVTGFQLKISEKMGVTALNSGRSAEIISYPLHRFFKQGIFPTISTQAALISRDFLLENSIRFVEGAVGQDTLFGWHISLAANNFIATNRAHLIYYADRAESVTNKINANFFKRSLLKEKAQVKLLNSYNLVEIYKRTKLHEFHKAWYYPKLARLTGSELKNAQEYLQKIEALYDQR